MHASETTGIRFIGHGRRWLFDKSILLDATHEKGNARKWRCPSPTRTDGEVTQITTDRAGNATNFGYDADGREILMTDPLGYAASKSYDADGEIASTTDRDGQTINYAYDADGRETQEAVVGGDTLAWSYDADGEEVAASNAQGGYQFGYDADGHVTRDKASGRTRLTAASVEASARRERRQSCRAYASTLAARLRYRSGERGNSGGAAVDYMGGAAAREPNIEKKWRSLQDCSSRLKSVQEVSTKGEVPQKREKVK